MSSGMSGDGVCGQHQHTHIKNTAVVARWAQFCKGTLAAVYRKLAYGKIDSDASCMQYSGPD